VSVQDPLTQANQDAQQWPFASDYKLHEYQLAFWGVSLRKDVCDPIWC